MISRIILTGLVILIAYGFIRQRKNAAAAGETPAARQSIFAADDFRLAAYLFLIMTIGIGAGLYYSRWQDDHTILTVSLHRDNQADPVIYQVYKYQLGERSFLTLDGKSITVASSERIVIEGLVE